jgi:hypothetical protein
VEQNRERDQNPSELSTVSQCGFESRLVPHFNGHYIGQKGGLTDMDNKWQLTINRVSNGFVLTTDNGEDITITRVLEEEDLEDSDQNARVLRKLVYEIAEYFALGCSKHSETRWDFLITKKEGEDAPVKTETDYYLR